MSKRLFIFSLLVVVTLLAVGGVLAQDDVVLHVFGPAAIDTLGTFAPIDLQEVVQQEVLDGFLAENPGVSEVLWDAQGPIEGGTTRVMTAHLAGERMDVIACAANPTNGAYVRRGVVRDITDNIQPWVDRFEPASLDAYTVGGRAYGIPVSTLSTSSFFYNTDVFNQLGLAEPDSYEELIEVAAVLDGAGYIPVLHQGKTVWMWPMWYFETAAQTMGDPIAKTVSNLRGEASFTDPEDVEALARIGQFVDDGILDRDSLSVDWDGMRSAFASQQSAIYYGGTWELPWLEENVIDFEWGVFEFPQLPDVPGTRGHGGGPDDGFCIYSGISDDILPHAVAFLEYVSRPEVAEKHLGIAQPLAASIKGVTAIESEIADDLRSNHFPNTVRFLDWIWPTEINDAFQGAIQGMVGGTITAEEGMAQVQAVYDDLVFDGYSYDD
jgi:raffinose/stachyose/melibiose transport system substrate-binding protein